MMTTQTGPHDAKAYAEFVTGLRYRIRAIKTDAFYIATVSPKGDDNLEDYREELEFGGFVVINPKLAIYDLTKPIDMALWMEG